MLVLVSLRRAVPAILAMFVLSIGNAAAQYEAFYQHYPDLRAHNEIVQTAFDQLWPSGFQGKTVAEAQKAIALKAYVLLNQNSGATSSVEQGQQPKIPYWLVLEEYNRARAEEPVLKDMSLPEFAVRMNDITGSRAYDKGLNPNWLERAGAIKATTFEPEDALGPLGVGAAAALLFWLFFRLPRRYAARRQSAASQQSVWRRALSPAITAAKIGLLLSVFSGIRAHHVEFAVRLQIILWFAAFLGIAGFVVVYLIALPICAATQRPNQTLQPTAGRRDDQL